MTSRRTRLGLLALLACLFTLGVGPEAQAKTPLDGNGMWIWYLSKSGGNAARVAKKAKEHNVDTVFIKSADGTDPWRQFTGRLVRNLHKKGLDVCAWHFVYGGRPTTEAKRSAEAKSDGADCLIIDAETDYEGKYKAADKYMTSLRQRVGRKYPVALAGFPYTDYHPSFPYSVFFRRGGAQLNMPQMYWKTIGTSVGEVFAHTYRWNLPYGKRIFPIGQTYDEPGAKQILGFRKEARSYGADGVNWWSWQETSGKEFNAVGGKLGSKRPREKRRYPALSKGSQGDLVVWLQETLKAWGRKVTVDGDFGKHTRYAVKTFQRGHGLPASGRVGGKTWKKLMRRKPVPTNWTKVKGGHGNGGNRRVTGASAPKSATLPSTHEFPAGSVPGHR